MIQIIDNYDSFTYNLVQRLGEIDSSLEIRVDRNDEVTVDEILGRKPDRLIVSPGPCTPNEAGISVEAVKRLSGQMPLLGVCLGPSIHWAGLWRQDCSRRSPDARQDRHDSSRR